MYPINAQNSNRSSDGNTGLQILCNNCIDALANDILVTTETNGNTKGIKIQQGVFVPQNPPTSKPAGNLFTYSSNSNWVNYVNGSPNSFNYARYAQTGAITYQTISHFVTPKLSASKPKIFLQNTTILWNAQDWEDLYCKDSSGLSGGGKSLFGLEEYKEQIKVLQPKIDLESTVFQQKMDNGNTTALINQINTCPVNGYGKLYSDLRKYSPYLSEEVLLSIIHKQGFPTNMLVNLMLVNTHVAKTYWLMDALRNLQPPIPNGQLKQVENKINVFSEMEYERMKLSDLVLQRDNALNNVEIFYAHDSLVSDNDSLISILQIDPRLSSKYQLVNHYFEKKDSIKADQLLANIPLLHTFDTREQKEYSKYKQLYNLKKQLLKDGKNFSFLSEQQQQLLLNELINPSLSLGEMNDLNALRQVEDVVIGKSGQSRGKSFSFNYEEPILVPAENKEQDFSTEDPGNEDLLMQNLMDKILMGENSLQLYPNPATKEANILYNAGTNVNKITIEISDVTGRNIKTYIADKNNNLIKINTQSFNKGIYYVILFVDGKRQKVEKLVIQ